MKPRTFLLATLCALALPALSPVWAQDKSATPAAPPETAPPAATVDANAVRRNLYDLALLRALQAVNFDAAQIKSLQTVVKETLETDKERRKKDDDAMREIATDVEKAHTGALAGEPIPSEVETKYVEKQKAVLARIGAAKRDSVEKILAVLYPTLTATQKTEMEKQSIAYYGTKRIPAKYRDKPETAPREAVLQLAAGAFVENVLLDDRMPTLLATLKPLKTGGEPAAKP